MLKLYCLPTIDAAIEISNGNPSQAVLELEAALPYELGGTPRSLTSILRGYAGRRILRHRTGQQLRWNLRNSSIIRALS